MAHPATIHGKRQRALGLRNGYFSIQLKCLVEEALARYTDQSDDEVVEWRGAVYSQRRSCSGKASGVCRFMGFPQKT